MKIKLLISSFGILLTGTTVFAQVVSKDSMQMLEKQKDAIELSKSVNDKKTQLAKLQNDLEKKNKEAQDAAVKAEQSAKENQAAASRLSSNAQDKKLANQAKSSARRAERDAKAARKAADNQKSTQEDIAKLQSEISEEESKIASIPAILSSGSAANSSAAMQTNTAAPAQPASVGAVSNPARISYGTDTARTPNASVRSITDRVIESTYKNYPQQPGQPSIIINNIIVPSDYERPAAKHAEATPQRAMNQSANVAHDDADYEDFLRWKNERRSSQQGNYKVARRTEEVQQQEVPYQRMGFKDRFGEMPKRKSGSSLQAKQ